MIENRGRPPINVKIRKKYIMEFDDSKWYYDLDKFANGPYLVEINHPKLDKLEKLHLKLEKLKEPKYHENGRKIRTTKINKKKIKNVEMAYWKEHYRLFPEDRPKKRGRRRTNRINS